MTTTSPCATPTPFETLVALWCGELPAEEAEALEEHLFACDACADASARLGVLVAGLRGFIPPVISHAHRDRLAASGVRLRVTPVEPGVDVEVFFAPEFDLLVHALKGDLAHADRVDIVLLDPAGIPRLEFEHVPFDRQTGEVLVACQRHYETLGAVPGDPRFSVHAYEGGVRRQVGSYFVRHQWR
jgi:hypothetical protein